MSVKAPKSSEAIGSHSNALQIRKNNASSVSNDHVFNVAVAIYQDADLSMDLVGYFGELSRELLIYDFSRRDPPFVQFFEAVDLIWLESL